MKNWKKRALSVVSSAALLAGVLSTGAFAAEPGAIGVELNGQAVAFTDAAPEASEGRTFLPFRAVFEALGAEVDFDKETKTVFATRGDTTVSMVVGAEEASVTEGDVTVTLPMDVTAYAKEGRTYVPVRFAAQALGCTVGWDNTDKTVILVDTATLIEEAVQDVPFTLMEKYTAYADKFNQGNWEMTAELSMLLTVMTTQVMTLDGTVSGLTASDTAGEMTMTLKMDMSGLIKLLAQMTGLTEEEILAGSEMTAAELKMDVAMEMRIDLDRGTLYMMMSGLPEEAGLPADTWLSMDLNEILDQSGLDMDQLTSLSQSFDPETTVAAQVALLELTDADTAYETVAGAVNAAVAALSDDAFTKNGLVYTNEIEQEGGSIVLKLTTNTAGDIVGYEMSGSLSLALADLGMDPADLAALGVEAEAIEMTMAAAMDADNAMTMTLQVETGTLFNLTMTLEGKYTATTKEPVTELPAGAEVVDYYDWLAGQAAGV